MELEWFAIGGYRRFRERSVTKLPGNLIAFVGPNEAGKSSLLEALTHLNHDGEFERKEYPRRSVEEPRLQWNLSLTATDRHALAQIPNCGGIEAVTVTKDASDHSRRRWQFHPTAPPRPRATRGELAGMLNALAGKQWIRDISDESVPIAEMIVGGLEMLESDANNFASEALESFSELAQMLSSIDLEEFLNDFDGDDEEKNALAAGFETEAQECASLIARFVTEEREPSPGTQARDVLLQRLPSIQLFRIADRDLHTDYDLAEIDVNRPPRALKHLAALAGLDLVALHQAATDGPHADVTSLTNKANQQLRKNFEAFRQHQVAVQIDVDGTVLHIQATTPDEGGVEAIDARSEGMRWFAALIAFTHGWAKNPILLVDEIETHLHYDAQADLINVLTEQDFASKVLYTTHSIGSLPNDLGLGVRVVAPDADHEGESKLHNGFWHGGYGFSPLLVAMGASTVAFTPSRYALFTEGETDALLLPLMFRSAAQRIALRFQTVAGLSVLPTDQVSNLMTEAGACVFLVDGDDGGDDLRDKLRTAGVDDDRMFRLGTGDEPLVLEDLLDAELYVRAVNKHLSLYPPATPGVFTVEDAGTTLRPNNLETWCTQHGMDKAPGKKDIAHRIIDIALQLGDPNDPVSYSGPVVAANHVDHLVELLAAIESALGISEPSTVRDLEPS
jgi:energy-coupling factor transporter ATP-binding protein EcfA2